MADMSALTSTAFRTFMTQAPDHGQAWTDVVRGLDTACALDRKTKHLSYLAVLAALRLIDGLAFHVALAKEAGATRQEVVSAVLIGLPAAGNAVVQALPAALAAFDGP